ncbi:hypothetical protein AAHA92_28054 [Salvia divinorum]|uniref:Uncharacterized protein n=1 Tax=Salvia divinorum TaxID=28513 RepID=A0ABD1G6R4_SALDI
MLVSSQMHVVVGMRDLDRGRGGALRPDSRDEPTRLLEAAEVKGMKVDNNGGTQNMGFDSNQSSKRKVPRGSDPIHNRS